MSIGLLFVCIYLGGVVFYSSHFLKNTYWNGFDVSGKSSKDVISLLEDYKLRVVEKTADGQTVTEEISARDLGLYLNDDSLIENQIKEQNSFGWLSDKKHEFSNKQVAFLDEDMWEAAVSKLSCFQEAFVTKPEDAHLSDYIEGTGYEIVPEITGNELDEKVAKEFIAEAWKDLADEADLTQSDCYLKPSVYKEDEGLLSLCQKLNDYSNLEITYQFGDTTEKVDGVTMQDWLSVSEGDVILDEGKVAEYVAGLRKKYDSIFRSREFDTSYGKTITITGGDYGWWMDYNEETKQLCEMIKNHESGSRTPVYYQAAAQYGAKDYGNTYVEINLTAQHLFFYQDGQLVLESDFVSGNESKGNGTPEGIYGITYKERNATLVGENYETPVSYWMPFNGNIGLHDASWRSEFGGNLYLTGGSHGCINLPPSVAEQLYGLVQKKTPVICYKLPGTEPVVSVDPVTGLPLTGLTNPSTGQTDQNAGQIPDPAGVIGSQ